MQKINKDAEARRQITENLKKIAYSGEPLTLRIIENQIENAINHTDLDTGAFWRFRSYFAYLYRENLTKGERIGFSWGGAQKSKGR